MDMLIPTPDALPVPAPLGLVQFLLVFTFILHLVPMNLLFGGGILAAISHLRAGKDDNHARLARRIAELMPVVIAFTVTLGVAPLLFVQVAYGQFLYSSSILMANAWFVVVPLVIIGYYGAYLMRFKWEALARHRVWLSWVLALLFAAVGFIYSNNFSLMLRPEIWSEHYFQDPARGSLIWSDASLYPRYLHMLFGAIAVAGLWIMLIGGRGKSGDAEWSGWAFRYGGKMFGHATLLNIAIGLWFMMSLPRPVMLIFMGQNMAATMLFTLSFILAFVAWFLIYRATKEEDGRGFALAGGGVLAAILVFMAIMRQQVRAAYLAPYFRVSELTAAPQWGVIALFAATLVIGLAVTGWLISVVMRSKSSEGES